MTITRLGGRRSVRYVGILAAFAAVTWLVFREAVLGPVLVPVRVATAEAAVSLIRAVGMEAERVGSAVLHPGGFAYEVSRGCTGLVPAALIAAAIGAYPAARYLRVVGIALAVPLMLGLNLVRLVHLFYLGVHRPAAFHFAHEVVWQGAVVIAVFVCWRGWIAWADRRERPTSGFHSPNLRSIVTAGEAPVRPPHRQRATAC
jgi:exosortase/archaeosortase family protein